MNICAGRRGKMAHSEIVYDDGDCPACESQDEIERLEKEIESLRDEINKKG